MKKLLTEEDYKRRQNTNLFKLLNNDLFWMKYKNAETSQYNIQRMREARTKIYIPQKPLDWFVKTYKFITWDKRSDKKVLMWLLSESED